MFDQLRHQTEKLSQLRQQYISALVSQQDEIVDQYLMLAHGAKFLEDAENQLHNNFAYLKTTRRQMERDQGVMQRNSTTTHKTAGTLKNIQEVIDLYIYPRHLSLLVQQPFRSDNIVAPHYRKALQQLVQIEVNKRDNNILVVKEEGQLKLDISKASSDCLKQLRTIINKIILKQIQQEQLKFLNNNNWITLQQVNDFTLMQENRIVSVLHQQNYLIDYLCFVQNEHYMQFIGSYQEFRSMFIEIAQDYVRKIDQACQGFNQFLPIKPIFQPLTRQLSIENIFMPLIEEQKKTGIFEQKQVFSYETQIRFVLFKDDIGNTLKAIFDIDDSQLAALLVNIFPFDAAFRLTQQKPFEETIYHFYNNTKMSFKQSQFETNGKYAITFPYFNGPLYPECFLMAAIECLKVTYIHELEVFNSIFKFRNEVAEYQNNVMQLLLKKLFVDIKNFIMDLLSKFADTPALIIIIKYLHEQLQEKQVISLGSDVVDFLLSVAKLATDQLMYRVEAQFTNYLNAPDLFKEAHRKAESVEEEGKLKLHQSDVNSDCLVGSDQIQLNHIVVVKKDGKSLNLPVFVVRLAFLIRSLVEIKPYLGNEINIIVQMAKQALYQLQDEIQLINSFKLLWIITKQDAFMECFEKVIRENEGFEEILLI